MSNNREVSGRVCIAMVLLTGMSLLVCGCHFGKLKLPSSVVPDDVLEKRLHAVLAESMADEEPLLRCHSLEIGRAHV